MTATATARVRDGEEEGLGGEALRLLLLQRRSPAKTCPNPPSPMRREREKPAVMAKSSSEVKVRRYC